MTTQVNRVFPGESYDSFVKRQRRENPTFEPTDWWAGGGSAIAPTSGLGWALARQRLSSEVAKMAPPPDPALTVVSSAPGADPGLTSPAIMPATAESAVASPTPQESDPMPTPDPASTAISVAPAPLVSDPLPPPAVIEEPAPEVPVPETGASQDEFEKVLAPLGLSLDDWLLQVPALMRAGRLKPESIAGWPVRTVPAEE